jgi:hypothetical protein
MSNNEPDGIEHATHNTFGTSSWIFIASIFSFTPNVLWVAFSIPSGTLLLVNHLVKATSAFQNNQILKCRHF